MTLANAKRLLLSLIDEQKPKSDITDKLIPFFNAGAKEIALYYPVYNEKWYSTENIEETTELPSDLFRATRCYTQSGKSVRFDIVNGEIKCAHSPFKLIYEAVINDIPQASPDTYELQTQEEAILALVYYVAAQLYNNEDGTGVFQSYYAQYQGKMQNLTAVPRLCAAVVYEGASNV